MDMSECGQFKDCHEVATHKLVKNTQNMILSCKEHSIDYNIDYTKYGWQITPLLPTVVRYTAPASPGRVHYVSPQTGVGISNVSTSQEQFFCAIKLEDAVEGTHANLVTVHECEAHIVLVTWNK